MNRQTKIHHETNIPTTKMKQTINKIHKKIDHDFPQHLKKIQEYIKQPSISADGTGMKETAEMTKSFIEELGGKAKIVPTHGWPVVYGELKSNAEKTLLIYGMYDVQPVEEEKDMWIVPPFSGQIVNIKPFGKCLVSRGAYNTKAPLRAFFNACDSILKVNGALPVNLIFVIEGEEELGSIHLPDFVKNYKEQLRKADAAFFPIPAQDVKGKVIMELGVKGIIYLDLLCQGGEWGGPTKRSIHSANAAWVDSPVWRLIWALNSMKNSDGKITIEGFYENVSPPSGEEEQLLKKLEETFDEKAIQAEIDVTRFSEDLHGIELLKRYLYSPTLNIDGIFAGYIGSGTKTVLPHEAKAKIDIRLVPHMTPENILAKLKKHLQKYGFTDIKVEVHDCYTWAQVSINEPIVQAMIRTYKHHGYDPEIWPRLGGSAPFYLFNHPPLNLPFVMGGLGHGGRAHSPNEYLVVKGIKENEKSIVTFLYEYTYSMYDSTASKGDVNLHDAK
jgi:acetylornithine deacetylase/succinyl-diaminopimelate desuccinylase-like protein